MRSSLLQVLAGLRTSRVNRNTVALQELDNVSRTAQHLNPPGETDSGMEIDICIVDA
jgi:hypothetical protein